MQQQRYYVLREQLQLSRSFGEENEQKLLERELLQFMEQLSEENAKTFAQTMDKSLHRLLPARLRRLVKKHESSSNLTSSEASMHLSSSSEDPTVSGDKSSFEMDSNRDSLDSNPPVRRKKKDGLKRSVADLLNQP